jgi:hypothetical protein
MNISVTEDEWRRILIEQYYIFKEYDNVAELIKNLPGDDDREYIREVVLIENNGV